ncbi:hypothetical protein FH972_020814 [Carpinus fangiana]|uniref:Uncharacterized protein n=1 Tax=Carpinus fangiana TaxID=176857 RepID=A0A5N6RYU0_9ROSI|nr:hypothetical protein FH972_020814 [Carpinus fangiana]
MENNVFGRCVNSKTKDVGDQFQRSDGLSEKTHQSPLSDPKKHRWKLLDFAELKRSSISFFDIEKPETAVSHWSRARTRAAKVGKGLSKDEKALKLALQHWLEAIDPRHCYGHNLQIYYVNWLQLDIGEGKEVTLERCPRLKLQQQCIKYLGPVSLLSPL